MHIELHDQRNESNHEIVIEEVRKSSEGSEMPAKGNHEMAPKITQNLKKKTVESMAHLLS